ncbi:MAG TPA: formylglycine-generating enzyme family protein [Draconibacterium sp.]|nr:formylglycine-generating enzyme family protein [Draconibacterium sp.]
MPRKHESTKSLKTLKDGQIIFCEFWCFRDLVASNVFSGELTFKRLFIFSFLFLFVIPGFSQIDKVEISERKGISIIKIETGQVAKSLVNTPIVSFKIGDKLCFSNQKESFENQFQIELIQPEIKNGGWHVQVVFTNISKDTLTLHNVVPLGENPERVYITGLGDHSLSRAHLFRPGFSPVNVILPDNAWELGYSEVDLDEIKIAALTRRASWENATRRRFETSIYPGGRVTYNLWMESFTGDWQEGLRKIFQEKMLFDVEQFDNTLFERDDLKWVRHTYLCQLMMGWDHQVYDIEKGRYTLNDFIGFNNKVLGGAEIYGLWPTWPALGMDQRNQWDMYRSMPGGMSAVRGLADLCHQNNSHFYIAFKPWDTATRKEDPYEALAESIKETGADGVVLDCSGASTEQLQKAGDNGGNGVVMYSEGMAVPKDMQGIVSGRVHNALYYCPMLNLNKLIKPEFAIFRVVEVGKERIRREYSLSLFNGYGTENNLFSPGRPYWLDEQWKYLAQILMIQRENAGNFTLQNWVPLLKTTTDSIFVNYWPAENKSVYTIFSLIPQGFNKPLFEVHPKPGFHFVDLWNHEPVQLDTIENKIYAVTDIESFSEKYVGTNNEGTVGAIAEFPELLKVSFNLPKDEMTFAASKGDSIKIYTGMPGYQGKWKSFPIQKQTIRLMKEFGREEGKFVVQLFDKGELADERIISFPPASARLISENVQTEKKAKAPAGMVKIPAGKFKMEVEFGDYFIPYPEVLEKDEVEMQSFYMDKFPVTNAQFLIFLQKSGYQPTDSENYLQHWENGNPKPGDENKPVVFVSYEDARAYAKWDGKRLPTEAEWQYAAQTEKLSEWPWGDKAHIIAEKEEITGTLTVEKLTGIDSTLCNSGNGTLDAVGSYPKGENPFGLQDLVGSVWQITNDVYDNCTYSFAMLKGGSYYKPEDSWWYVQGGPKNLRWRQMLLRVSQGFERKATVGFRCVADAE